MRKAYEVLGMRKAYEASPKPYHLSDMPIYTCICICIYVYVYMYMYIYTYIYIYICMPIRSRMRIHIICNICIYIQKMPLQMGSCILYTYNIIIYIYYIH